MGESKAIITRRMFDEAKRYVETVLQAGVPLVDADYNDQMDSTYTQLRRIIQSCLGDGALGDAFLISQNLPDPANNFLINGGQVPTTVDFTVNADKTVELPQPGPEGLFNKGLHAQLLADETFKVGVETAPTSTGITQTAIPDDTLEDSAAQFVPGAFVGMVLTPDLTDPGTTHVIIANTANGIQVGAAITAPVGANYRVGMTTPVVDRKDLVYLDCYLDEIDSAEDTDLKHTIDSMQITAMLRWKLIETVLVIEDIALPYTMPSGWTDTDGNPHVLVPLALIERVGGNPNITDAMITDLRRKIFRLDEIDDRFVNVTGDTMTGTLVMEANITLALGRRVLGTCIIDGNALCEDTVANRHMKRDSHLLGDLDAVPTWSEVNDPIDAGYFKVHDNRYYTKTEIDSILGRNLVSNGMFEDGFVLWENDAPRPLYGYPPLEASRAIVSISLCGTLCGEEFCGCRALEVHLPVGNRSCIICAVRQEVCGGIKCGGEFLLIENICVTQGDEAVIPYFVLDLYSSCRYVGTRMIRMWEPGLDDPFKPGLTIQDGLTRLEKRIELAKCVDNAVLTLCFEIIPLTELPPIPPVPPECDECRQGDPLGAGTGAMWACIENPVQITPWAMCRFFDPDFAPDNDISVEIYSNRPSAPVRIMLVDEDGKRAYYDHVCAGGIETVTVSLAAMTIPDGTPNWAAIVSWCLYWTEPLAHDEYATDNWKTAGGVALVEGWDDVETLLDSGEASCGYFSEPEAPRGLEAPRDLAPPILTRDDGPLPPLPYPPTPACEVGPEPFEFSVCAAQIRRISGPEGEIDPGVGCKTNKIPVITNVYLDGRVEFVTAFNQVQTVLEVLEEECLEPETEPEPEPEPPPEPPPEPEPD